jgi:primosomal protein N' (replication factor Y)
VPVRTSGGSQILDRVPASPALVVATPGAEPTADGGYGAVLLLDTWALLTRADLRAAEETLRRWCAAAALARPAGAGGRVVVVADRATPVAQALVRWDPGWAAERELADRVALGFPPAVRLADLTGAPSDVADLLASLQLPPSADVLGPVAVGDGDERMLIRVPRSDGAALAAALKSGQGGRSARHDGGSVRVRLDPVEIG